MATKTPQSKKATKTQKKIVRVDLPSTPLPEVRMRPLRPGERPETMPNPIIDELLATAKPVKKPALKKPAEVIAKPAKVPAVKPEKKAPRPRKPKRPTWKTEFKCKTLGGLGGL